MAESRFVQARDEGARPHRVPDLWPHQLNLPLQLLERRDRARSWYVQKSGNARLMSCTEQLQPIVSFCLLHIRRFDREDSRPNILAMRRYTLRGWQRRLSASGSDRKTRADGISYFYASDSAALSHSFQTWKRPWWCLGYWSDADGMSACAAFTSSVDDLTYSSRKAKSSRVQA